MTSNGHLEEGDSTTILNAVHLVPKKSGEYRQITDLRKVNLGVETDHFKMETLEAVAKFLKKGFWATKIDLAEGYFHIPIHPSSRRLLGFIWKGQIFQYTVLPFGLNQAPWIFTKVMKQVAKKWRSEGMIIFIYIDDILVLGCSQEECMEITSRVIQDLKWLGFLIKEEMCTDTDSTNHISGNSFGFPTRIVQNSGGQTTDCNPIHHQNTNSIPPKIPSLTKMDLPSDWQTSIPFDCSPSHPSVPLSSSNQHDECSPSKRMESLDANHERSNERSDSITVSNSGEQRNTLRNGMESSGRQHRRKSTRLWSPFKRAHSLRNVERRHENSPHQQSRIESSPHVLSDCHDSSCVSTRDSVPSSNRQHDSSSLHTQGLWSSPSLGEHCKSNLDSPTETKMVNSQGFLHSVRKKSNRRSVVKTRPMGNLSRTFQSRGEELWPPRRRSLRKSQEFTYDYIQLLYEGKRRSYGTVGRFRGSKKLLCSPSWADVSVLASCYSEQSKGNIYRSYLAHRNLVSNLTKDIQKDNNVSKKFAQKLALAIIHSMWFFSEQFEFFHHILVSISRDNCTTIKVVG
ncbi:hypothetical protein C9374_003761 [Naegleria lovaniensis]|uniref:Reverse transcriptase domain-containing protein n=1 Tax=Naegleria lovaniensis TaxID=51637 RepID=A0AA88KSB1_NAELO|nr:uncharacterized protein C9374_003761 [Naegleria lovaniensis]KAG2393997.1 hypothetical protein C9374_003761 [Naegleria lovaniensis]